MIVSWPLYNHSQCSYFDARSDGVVYLPRDASAERGDATVSRLSVGSSVCLSVCL